MNKGNGSKMEVFEKFGFEGEEQKKAFGELVEFAKEEILENKDVKVKKKGDVEVEKTDRTLQNAFFPQRLLKELQEELKSLGTQKSETVKPFVRFLRKLLAPKNIRVHVTKEDKLQKINDKKEDLVKPLKTLGFYDARNTADTTKPIHQVRFFGTNHILFRKQVQDFVQAVEDGKIKLDENCKFLLLGGKHINNNFGEDDKPEIDIMKEIVNQEFKKIEESKISEDNSLQILKDATKKVQEGEERKIIEITPKGKFKQETLNVRPNTVATVFPAEKEHKAGENDNVLYVGGQPVLFRQMFDLIGDDLYKGNCFMFGSGVEEMEKFLEREIKLKKEKLKKLEEENKKGKDLEEKTTEETGVQYYIEPKKVNVEPLKKEIKVLETFKEQTLAYCLANFAQMVYTIKNKVLGQKEERMETVKKMLKEPELEKEVEKIVEEVEIKEKKTQVINDSLVPTKEVKEEEEEEEEEEEVKEEVKEEEKDDYIMKIRPSQQERKDDYLVNIRPSEQKKEEVKIKEKEEENIKYVKSIKEDGTPEFSDTEVSYDDDGTKVTFKATFKKKKSASEEEIMDKFIVDLERDRQEVEIIRGTNEEGKIIFDKIEKVILPTGGLKGLTCYVDLGENNYLQIKGNGEEREIVTKKDGKFVKKEGTLLKVEQGLLNNKDLIELKGQQNTSTKITI